MSLLLAAALSSGLVLSGPRFSAPALRAQRVSVPRCGFEVETLSDNDVMEMNIMNWPGLEKRTSEFYQYASDEEVKMVYVKDGEAVISDDEETKTVSSGSLVMIQGGETKWDVTEGSSVTLISLMTSTDEVTEEGSSGGEPVQDLTIKEAALLLGGGLLFGGIASTLYRIL